MKVAARLKVAKLRPLTSCEAAELQGWEKELEEFDQKYWIHKREWYKLVCEKPDGPWIGEWDVSARAEAMLSPEIRYCAPDVARGR